jgi:hypothetical protein
MAEPLFKDSVNSFKNNNRGSFYHFNLSGPLVCREIITRNLAVFSAE